MHGMRFRCGRKSCRGKRGKSVVMKSDYIYDSGVFLSFVSPLQDLLQPRKSEMRRSTERAASVVPLSSAAVLCHRVSFLKSPFWAPLIINQPVSGWLYSIRATFPGDHVCKTKCHSFFIELWNPKTNESRSSVFFSWINAFIQIGWPLFTVPWALIHALNPLCKKRLMMLTLSYSAAVSEMATVPGQAGKVAYSLS